jgi:hypothetical protein
MAKPQLREVTFNEGEPLDPNKLNDLKQNIIAAYELASTNISDAGYKTLMDSGFVNIAIKNGVGLSEVIPFTNPNFNSPQIIATIASEIKSGLQVTLSVINSTTKPQIKVSMQDTKINRTLKVDYLIIQKQILS